MPEHSASQAASNACALGRCAAQPGGDGSVSARFPRSVANTESRVRYSCIDRTRTVAPRRPPATLRSSPDPHRRVVDAGARWPPSPGPPGRRHRRARPASPI